MRFTAASEIESPGLLAGIYEPRESVDVIGASMAVGLYRVLACFASWWPVLKTEWPRSNVSNFEQRTIHMFGGGHSRNQ